MKDFVIYYHDLEPGINRCWGNSKAFKVSATNCVGAIKKFYARAGNELPIYDIEDRLKEICLGYDATQALLRLEGFTKA